MIFSVTSDLLDKILSLITNIGLHLLNSFNEIEDVNWSVRLDFGGKIYFLLEPKYLCGTLMIHSSNNVVSSHTMFCALDFLHTYSSVCAGANGIQ